MTELLKPYVPIVDFLADYLGEHTEVVLHDFSDLEHSIVKIRNGHISGQRENDPCADFVLRKLKNPPIEGDYDASYIGRDCHGSPLKSSTFYIRDNERKIIGTICINTEIDVYRRMREYLDNFFGVASEMTPTPPIPPAQENFAASIGDMVNTILARTIDSVGPVERLTSDEKSQIIGRLNDEGLFLLKGSVAKTGAALGISEPTVYRYLSQYKKD